jgi:hypothetical protein
MLVEPLDQHRFLSGAGLPVEHQWAVVFGFGRLREPLFDF